MKLAQSIHSFMEDIQARMQHPIPLPKPGIYHYLRQLRGGKARVHLRIEVDGFGTLLVNASRI